MTNRSHLALLSSNAFANRGCYLASIVVPALLLAVGCSQPVDATSTSASSEQSLNAAENTQRAAIDADVAALDQLPVADNATACAVANVMCNSAPAPFLKPSADPAGYPCKRSGVIPYRDSLARYSFVNGVLRRVKFYSQTLGNSEGGYLPGAPNYWADKLTAYFDVKGQLEKVDILYQPSDPSKMVGGERFGHINLYYHGVATSLFGQNVGSEFDGKSDVFRNFTSDITATDDLVVKMPLLDSVRILEKGYSLPRTIARCW